VYVVLIADGLPNMPGAFATFMVTSMPVKMFWFPGSVGVYFALCV